MNLPENASVLLHAERNVKILKNQFHSYTYSKSSSDLTFENVTERTLHFYFRLATKVRSLLDLLRYSLLVLLRFANVTILRAADELAVL